MVREYAFPRSVRLFGLLGLFGLITFISSIITMHLTGNGVDWSYHYVSNLANQPLGWIFMLGTFIHGCGNLALALGLHGALPSGRLRIRAVLLFGLAAAGILLTAFFPTDPPGQVQTMTGQIHRTAASTSFALELAAMYIFSMAFRRHHQWRRQWNTSLVLSTCAAVALFLFVIAIQLEMAPGLAERFALAIFMAWEIWACMQLIRPI